MTYFVTGQCWSALVGCVVFLAYGPWRKWWRSRVEMDWPCDICGKIVACPEDCCSIVVVLPPTFGRVHEWCAMDDEERTALKAAAPEDRCDVMERVRDRTDREYNAARERLKSFASKEECP